MASKFNEAMRQLLASEARCPNPRCGAVNTVGPGGTHITVNEHGVAVCHECLTDWIIKASS